MSCDARFHLDLCCFGSAIQALLTFFLEPGLAWEYSHRVCGHDLLPAGVVVEVSTGLVDACGATSAGQGNAINK